LAAEIFDILPEQLAALKLKKLKCAAVAADVSPLIYFPW
jgi:hypothetical protein